jgi:uncharacterized membrane protein YfcA
MWLFIIFLFGDGVRMIYTIWEKKVVNETCLLGFSKAMHAAIIIFRFAVGIISGLLGVGGGILIVPFLLFLCKFPTNTRQERYLLSSYSPRGSESSALRRSVA